MKFILSLILISLLDSSAKAEEPIVAACHAAVAFFNNVDLSEMKVKNIQAFPELSPPRVNLRRDNMMSTSYSCQFKNSTKPFKITKICNHGDICYSANDQKFQEVKTLMNRAGF